MPGTPAKVRVLTPQEKTLLSARPAGLRAESANGIVAAADSAAIVVAVYDERALSILGTSPTLDCVLEYDEYPFAHEAGVYLPATKEVVITSNRILPPQSSPGGKQSIMVSSIRRDPASDGGGGAWSRRELGTDLVPMANGGVNYRDGVLICAQGYGEDQPGGLTYLEPSGGSSGNSRDAPPAWTAQPLLNHYHGRAFNSPNDVVVAADGAIWFTDPTYGAEQGFKPEPRLPPQVYRFDPATGDVRVVADGLKHPNGIAFAPGERVCYVTDTDWIWGNGDIGHARASTIYAFDVVPSSVLDPTPTLANRRVFAMADSGVPDGIKCDVMGNVYSGCGDGLNVWSPGGTLLFKVLIPGGVANFCFCESAELILLNETTVWVLQLHPEHKGALLRL